MIKTPIQPFGFSSLIELKEHLDKNYYNEQPVTVLKADLSKLLDMAIEATVESKPEVEKKAEKKTKKKSEESE